MLKLLIWIRSLFASVIALVITFFVCVGVIISALLGSRRGADLIVWFWGESVTRIYNIKVKVIGTENLPDEGVLFVFNHTSLMDIIIFCQAIRKSARFGAKIELFKIPVFGLAMKLAGALPISRAERSKVLRLYDESIQRVHNGESFILAAEGTRQMNAGVGARFKSGPFIFALNGQFPIVPIVLRGATECLPRHRLIPCTDTWKSYVVVQILKPVQTKGLVPEDRATLQNDVQNLMTTAYNSR